MSLSSKKLNPEGSLMLLGSSVTRFFIKFKATVLTLAPITISMKTTEKNIN